MLQYCMIRDSVRGRLPEDSIVDMTTRVKSSELRRSLKKGAREAVEESPYVTKEEAREMIDEVSGSYRVEELRENLPEEIFEAVMDHLDLDDSPAETMEEVGKSIALAEELYDETTPSGEDGFFIGKEVDETDSAAGVGASHHLNGPDPFEEPEVNVSKSGGPILERFYEGMEGR